MIYGGREVEDDTTLADYNVEEGGSVYLGNYLILSQVHN
jgi:hypothetical protein